MNRLVVWTQFGYFGGKQERIGLKGPDPAVAQAAHDRAVEKWQKAVEKWEAKQEEEDQAAEGAYSAEARLSGGTVRRAYHTSKLAGVTKQVPAFTPGVGFDGGRRVFYIRPDRWDSRCGWGQPRRPVSASRSAGRSGHSRRDPERRRGAASGHGGLADQGHREWASAVPSGDLPWLAKAHVREGVWPLIV